MKVSLYFGEQAYLPGQTEIVTGVKPPGVIDHGEAQGDKKWLFCDNV